MTTHANSISSFLHLDLGARQAAVMAAIGSDWLTDRQVAERLGAEVYTIRPRITELLASGKITEVGTGADHVTGRRVRICAVNP